MLNCCIHRVCLLFVRAGIMEWGGRKESSGIYLGWIQREKGEHSRCPATKLGNDTGAFWSREEGEMRILVGLNVSLQEWPFGKWDTCWVPGQSNKPGKEVWKGRSGGSTDPLEIRKESQGKLPRMFCYTSAFQAERGLELEQQRDTWRCTVSLPVF